VVGVQHRRGRVDGLQLQRLDQRGQEPPDLRVGGDQPLVEGISRRAHQRLHRAHVRLDPLPLDAQRRQHLLQGGRVVEGIQQRAHLRVHRGDSAVVVAKLAGAAFLPAVGGGALQVAEHDIEDVDHIVAGAGRQQVGVGDQRGDPPLRCQIGQLGGPGLVGVAGQGHYPRGRHVRQVQPAGAQGPNPLQPVQRAHQPGDGGRERRPAQQVQLRAALPLRHHQEFVQLGPQLRAGCSRQAAVNPMGGAFAHRGDQPSQHGLPGQQDLPGKKLPVGRAEQHRRGHLIGPGLLVQPDGEGEPVRPSEVAVPVAVPDLGAVTPPHRHVPVAGRHFQVIDAELACHSGHDRLRYRGRVRLERADRPDGDQLGRISQLGHWVGPAPDQRQVRPAQMAHPPQPVPVQLSRKLGVRCDAGSIRRCWHTCLPASTCCRRQSQPGPAQPRRRK
jgi:hypothetical protein